VRSLGDDSKVGPLKQLFKGIELVEADLLGGSEAFEKAVEGCTYVLHTASPFKMSCDDPQKDFVDPALKGTETVVAAAKKAGVKKVVVTSSCAAIGPPQAWMKDPSAADAEKVFSEEDWNTDSTLQEGPYRLSKTLAEKKAWELAEGAEGFAVSVICPSFVIGPMMSGRADAESVKFIQGMLDGSAKEKLAADPKQPVALGVIDVREVAAAHVSAMEKDAASGKRFILSQDHGYAKTEMADMISKPFRAYPLPLEGETPVYVPKYNNSRAKEILKIRFRPVAASIKDMAVACVRNGIVEKKEALKPTKWGRVDKLYPDSKNINLLVKVVKHLEEEETKQGTKILEVVLGDATGLVTARLVAEEIPAAVVGDVVEVRNSSVTMKKGFVRLQIGKWGKISKHTGDTTIEPKEDKDMSATEYELVPQ